MRLIYRLTRQDSGNRQLVFNGTMEFNGPLLKAAVLDMSFTEEDPVTGRRRRNYRFSGEAAMSFADGQLKDEHCNVSGSISTFHNTTLYYGCVTYYNFHGSTTPAKGLICRFLGQMLLPVPKFYPFRPHPSSLQVIQSTHQQLQNQGMLFASGHTMVEAAAALIIAQELCPSMIGPSFYPA